MAAEPAPVVMLMGPTAAGKTALALSLARALDAEVVSVDSAQVYRGMDIGTAKPAADVLAEIPHHLIDIVEPHEIYSAARFRRDALAAIEAVRARGHVPLLAGGTMLYFSVLQRGLAQLPGAQPALRAELDAQARRRGWDALHRELARVDPHAAARIHRNDPQRIQRALEVWHLTGVPLSELQRRVQGAGFPYRTVKLVLAPHDRAELHRRIERRFDEMLAAGLVQEVAALRRDPRLSPALPAMRAVGYRQVWRYLSGEWTHARMRERALAASRQLAKRQLTWLRREADADWLQSPDPRLALARVRAAASPRAWAPRG